MSCLERAMKRRRKAIPSMTEVEMMLAEEQSDKAVVEAFEGWIDKRRLPPETVLKTLLEGGWHYERKGFPRNY